MPEEYLIQDDEEFVSQLKTSKTVASLMVIYCLVVLLVYIVALLCKDVMADVFQFGDMIQTIVYALYLAILIGIIIGFLYLYLLKKSWDVDYYLTTKRLYVKTQKDSSYVAYDKEKIAGLNKPFLMSIRVQMVDGSHISVYISSKSEHNKIINTFYGK